MRIALDAMGGDRGPDELVKGAFLAAEEYGCEVTLLGDEGKLRPLIAGANLDRNIQIVHAPQVILMDESPIEAIRRKKDSSIVMAFDLLKQKKVDAVVSAGNTGATMAAAIKSLGRQKHVARPGIAGVFPTLKGPVVMMDVGANVDCRPQHLFQFGVMASAFSGKLFGIREPRIGILSIGEEGGKGNTLVKRVHELFLESNLNYIGNVEGKDIFMGNVDVIVCDGFVGNVCLKVSEGLVEAILRMLRGEIGKSFLAKVGYKLAQNAFTHFKKRVDYTEYGGAPLLGLNGTGIICHGRSNAKAIKNAIRVAGEVVRTNVNASIEEILCATMTDVKGNGDSDAGLALDSPGAA